MRCYAATPGHKEFPPWNQMISDGRPDTFIYAPSEKVLAALSALELVADPTSGVFIIINSDGLRLQLVDQGGRPGASTSVEVSAAEGDGYAIVELRHLRQAIEPVPGGTVVIGLQPNLGETGVVEISDETGTKFTAVVSAR